KAMRARYKISKAQVFEEAKKQGRDISKIDEAKGESLDEEWNKRAPVYKLKIADTDFSKE
ncbi:MAG: hypothetical protein MKZ96_06255, partial [Candidatus Atelocyanobacterium sp. ALOHA_A2.5_9]|nr:hypothetical protein [Candidatus Atelocyanobacterium sp. ALOHA_A2.5_9]